MDKIVYLNDLYYQERKEIGDIVEGVMQNKKETIIDTEAVSFEEGLVSITLELGIVVGLSLKSRLFLQICHIGAGIPRINKKRADYVRRIHNGHIIGSIS